MTANNVHTDSRYSPTIRDIRDYSGFTLIEILLVVAILAITGTFATFGFTNVRKVKDLEHDTRAVVAYLRDAQQRSITGADGAEWRVEFHNVSGGQDFFELIPDNGPTPGVAAVHVALKSTVEFSNFYYTSGNSLVQVCCTVPTIFERLSGKLVLIPGTPAPYIVELRTVGGSCPADCRTVTIDANGLITY